MAWLVAILALAAVAFKGLWILERRRLRRLRDQLERARVHEDAAAAARETFFDLVTHELRSPLAAILGYQELLLDGAYGHFEGAEEPIDRIGRSARHLLHLIDGVVELSRLRTGEVRPDLGPVNLAVLGSAVADAFRTHARERHLEAVTHVPPALPTIRSDQDRLVRALDLLVTSALKHPAGPALELAFHPEPDALVLSLQTTDIHLRPSEDPALRLGIQLAIAERIAHLLGGELRLEPVGEPVVKKLVFRVPSA